jgi:hypothetical protein
MPDRLLEKRSRYADTSDADLIETLHGAPMGEHAVSGQAEMISRLRRSLLEFKASADRWSRVLTWLTVALIVLTIAVFTLTAQLVDRAH